MFRNVETFVDDVEQNIDFLHSKEKRQVINQMFFKFRCECYCTKHAGFKAVKEWRVGHTPNLAPPTTSLKRLSLFDVRCKRCR